MSISKAIIFRGPSTDSGTFGWLYTKGFHCHTLELPWRDNKRSISCIPKGVYKVKWTYSRAFKRRMYLVASIPKRDGIRIHSANYAGDASKGYKKHLYGCIALGKRRAILDGQRAVLVSRPTVRKFEKAMQNKTFLLEIK